MLKRINWKEFFLYSFMITIIVLTTGYTFLLSGVSGYINDLAYHMLRIESVKEALLNWSYPARVNSLFFNGYGYGSSFFYPDIFLVIPAVFRICGLSPAVSWKLYILVLAAVASTTTYFSFKYIIRNAYYAATGTVLLMLSQYYIANIMIRDGISEYIAYIFMPILVAGIYDFFARDGEKVYLLGIAFVGLLLSHTIMTVVGLVITSMIFIFMLFVPSKRKCLLKPHRLFRLLVVTLISVAAVSFYVFPMVEQMVSDEFLYMEPWAQIGDYTQPFRVFFNVTGDFDYIAYIGVGIPLIMLMGSRALLGRPENKWSDFFFFGGIAIFVATTDVIPWERFNETFLNVLQFTFRLYPYGLCFITLGLVLYLAEKCEKNTKSIFLFVVVASVVFGIWQNQMSGERYFVNEEYLLENTCFVGRGEWLPMGVADEVRSGEATRNVVGSARECIFIKEGYNQYSFENKTEKSEVYTLPLLYYKGYKAEVACSDGGINELEVYRREDGLAEIFVGSGMQGTIKVWYAGTIVQHVSNWVSLLVVVCLGSAVLFKKMDMPARRKKHIL